MMIRAGVGKVFAFLATPVLKRICTLSALLLPWFVVQHTLTKSGLAQAERLGRLIGSLYGVAESPAPVQPLPPLLHDERVEVFEVPPPPPVTSQRTHKRKRRRSAAPKRGVRVREGTILRLARARAVPDSVPVVPEGARPAGLRLNGVSALGIGMRNGDVITHVAGTAVHTKSEVVTQVLHARARKAESISGTFWRDGKAWLLIVELPYLQRQATPSPSASGSGG